MKFSSAFVIISSSTLAAAAFAPIGVSRQASSSSSSTSLSMADRRVVVTGMGITSCLGNTLEDVTKSLHECVSGLDYDPEWAELGIKSNVRGRPTLTDDEFKTLIPKADLRFMGKNAQYAYVAMQRAVEDSGMKPEDYQENPRVCAILGQGGTSIPDIVETVEAVKGGGRWTTTTTTLAGRLRREKGKEWDGKSAVNAKAVRNISECENKKDNSGGVWEAMAPKHSPK